MLSGRRAQFVRPVGPGEIMLLETEKGWREGREALIEGLGGEVMCRVGMSKLRPG